MRTFRSSREKMRKEIKVTSARAGSQYRSPPGWRNVRKALYLVGKADVGRRHVSDRQHGCQSWTSSHRHHEDTGEFRSIQVFDFVKHAPDHDTVLKRYETSLDAMATTRRPYTR